MRKANLGKGPDDVANNCNIRLKHQHTLNVSRDVGCLSSTIGLPKELRALAQGAALLHDVGRFPQIVQHRTYRDTYSFRSRFAWSYDCERRRITRFIVVILRQILFVLRFNIIAVRTYLQLFRGDKNTVCCLVRDADKLDIVAISIDYVERENRGEKTNIYAEVSLEKRITPLILDRLLSFSEVPLNGIETIYDEFLLFCLVDRGLSLCCRRRAVCESQLRQ